MRPLLVALVALALAGGPVHAEPLPVIHYHEVLAEMAEAGAKQRGAQDGRVEYDDEHDRVIFRARKSAGIVWLDVRLACTFVRDGARVRLQLISFTVGPLKQNASRFDEAADRLAKLVAVETVADRVVVLKAGKLVYEQAVP